MSWDTVAPYHRGFREFAEAYDALGFEDVHADALPFLPKTPGLLLDVGAGSGRDASWFAARGWEVVAAEPAAALRDEARRRHPEHAIHWIDDRLPALTAVHRQGLGFDLVWLSGVWMHIQPEGRARAMRKLATLLRPGGRLVLTLRHGPAPADRPMWPVDAGEVERLGVDHGLALRVATERRADIGGRDDVRWQTVILDLPDDGGGALPLLRGVILRQEKSATYKLALLRAIARIADASPNVAVEQGDDVVLPLGLVALYWLRMFKPLVAAGLPQLPSGNMAFIGAGFHGIAGLAPFDLRPGATVAGDTAAALRVALRDAARHIDRMPATHLTYANNQPVFPTEYKGAPTGTDGFTLTQDFLSEYGTTRVPLGVWNALRRMAAWIEPMLLAEWTRLTLGYAARQGISSGIDEVSRALRWLEPSRDTEFVRRIAESRLASGATVRCTWSGRALRAGAVDVDHCLPWSAWPCGDLWNLLPAAPAVNRHGKRERIVTAQALLEARPTIMEWWQHAYVEASAPVRRRFVEEARTTLPIDQSREPDLAELFAALDFRRLRLRQETQLPEWSGIARRGSGGPLFAC